MKNRLIKLTAFIFVSAFALVNCSKDGDENTVKDYKGKWSGLTSYDGGIYIHVDENEEIDSLKVYVTVNLGSGTCTGLYLYKKTTTDPVVINEDGTFEVEVLGIQMGFLEDNILISGKFNSFRNCTGEFGGVEVSPISCGGYLSFGIGMGIDPFTWSATKD